MSLKYKIGKIDDRGYNSYIRSYSGNIDSSHIEFFNFVDININNDKYEISDNKFYFFLINSFSGEIIMPNEDIVNNGIYEIWWDESNCGIKIKEGDLIIITNFDNNILKFTINNEVVEKRKAALIKRRINLIDNITNKN